jgi:hypothetical protein
MPGREYGRLSEGNPTRRDGSVSRFSVAEIGTIPDIAHAHGLRRSIGLSPSAVAPTSQLRRRDHEGTGEAPGK